MDYLPVLSFLAYWFYGAFLGALVIGEARYLWLGAVSAPCVLAMLAAAARIARNRGTPPSA